MVTTYTWGNIKVLLINLMSSQGWHPLFWNSSSPSVMPAASPPFGNLSEMQILGSHPKPTKSETLGTSPAMSFSQRSRWLWRMWMLEKRWVGLEINFHLSSVPRWCQFYYSRDSTENYGLNPTPVWFSHDMSTHTWWNGFLGVGRGVISDRFS